MGIGRHSVYSGGAHATRGRSRPLYRGSRKRLQRLKWYRHTSIDFWLFVTFVLLLLFVGVPWMINHPAPDNHRPISTPAAIPNP
jgi:hypothetical protein